MNESDTWGIFIKQANLKRLRVLEIGVSLIILVLGVVLWWPGIHYGVAFFAALAIALVILELVYIIRTYAKGISEGRWLSVTLSMLAILIAVWVLATLSFHVTDLLAIGVLFAGIASAAYGTASGKIVGILAIFISIVVFISPEISGVLALLVTPIALLFPDFTYHEIPAALVTLSLMILALEPLVAGIKAKPI
ncbi:MAG: hypothetical protein ACXV7G_06645 [Halobacteriota archaeon]